MKNLIIGVLCVFSIVTYSKDLSYESRDMVNLTLACNAEISNLASDYSLVGGKIIELSDGHEFDEQITLNFGYASPLSGIVVKTSLVIEKRFTKNHCPQGAMDCGGGTYHYECGNN